MSIGKDGQGYGASDFDSYGKIADDPQDYLRKPWLPKEEVMAKYNNLVRYLSNSRYALTWLTNSSTLWMALRSCQSHLRTSKKTLATTWTPQQQKQELSDHR